MTAAQRVRQRKPCPQPRCTGVHSHKRPYADWCPRTLRLADRAKFRWACRQDIGRTLATIGMANKAQSVEAQFGLAKRGSESE